MPSLFSGEISHAVRPLGRADGVPLIPEVPGWLGLHLLLLCTHAFVRAHAAGGRHANMQVQWAGPNANHGRQPSPRTQPPPTWLRSTGTLSTRPSGNHSASSFWAFSTLSELHHTTPHEQQGENTTGELSRQEGRPECKQ